MFTRPTILAKGMILIAVPLLFQLGFIALASRMTRESTAAERWTVHTKEVIARAQTCRMRLLAAHGAIQGSIITRDPAFGDELARQRGMANRSLAALPGLVADNPDQTEAARRLIAQATGFLGFLTDGGEMIRRDRMDPAAAASRRRRGQVLLDGLEAGFEAFVDEEQRLDKARHRRLDWTRARFDRLLAIGGVVSVLATVLVAVLFARNISGRIAVLTENSRRLASGRELTPPIGGGDEVALLDRVFHEMAGTLAGAARRERTHADQIGRRAEELSSLNDQLREKAEENEMFVYSVSHDLRSPLVNLQGFSKELGHLGNDLLKQLDRDDVPADVRLGCRGLIEGEMAESIGFIRTAVTRLSAIIDALLRLSRAGRVEFRREAVDVASVVRRVVGALRVTIDERGSEVAVGDLPPAWGDPTAVEQVFANLIGNALNYLDPKRPGRVEVFAVDPGGLAEGLAPAGSVVYAVRDNGLGIPDSYKGKIFTAFQRLHGDVAKGEGVGLALVRRTVERHRGRVWFESESGRGTTFSVALPSRDPGPPRGVEGDPAGRAEAVPGREVAWQTSR